MDRGDSNHSDAKYETSLDGHEILRSQNHDITTMVRSGHDHEVGSQPDTPQQCWRLMLLQGIIVRHAVPQDGLRVIHGQPNENNHEGIMDLAQHSDHSNWYVTQWGGHQTTSHTTKWGLTLDTIMNLFYSKHSLEYFPIVFKHLSELQKTAKLIMFLNCIFSSLSLFSM